MVAAGVAVVDLHGAAAAGRLMPLFGGYLERRPAGMDEVCVYFYMRSHSSLSRHDI